MGSLARYFGFGSALIAVYVRGASWSSSSTPPDFFAPHRLLTYDYFLASALIVGAMFQIGACGQYGQDAIRARILRDESGGHDSHAACRLPFSSAWLRSRKAGER